MCGRCFIEANEIEEEDDIFVVDEVVSMWKLSSEYSRGWVLKSIGEDIAAFHATKERANRCALVARICASARLICEKEHAPQNIEPAFDARTKGQCIKTISLTLNDIHHKALSIGGECDPIRLDLIALLTIEQCAFRWLLLDLKEGYDEA